MNRFILYTILLSIHLSACSPITQANKDLHYLNSILDLDELDNQLILVIPTNGCSGCTQVCIDFAKNLINKNDFYILLIGDDIKEAVYYKKEYFSNSAQVIVRDSQDIIGNGIDIQFPSYYFISKAGTEKTIINGQNLNDALSKIKSLILNDKNAKSQNSSNQLNTK